MASVQQSISTPGKIQQATVNVTGQLKKTVNLTPFHVDVAEDPQFDPLLTQADDILFGGWGNDSLHGGVGDDAIVGAEALDEAYMPAYASNGSVTGLVRSDYNVPVNPGNSLQFHAQVPTGGQGVPENSICTTNMIPSARSC